MITGAAALFPPRLAFTRSSPLPTTPLQLQQSLLLVSATHLDANFPGLPIGARAETPQRGWRIFQWLGPSAGACFSYAAS